MRQDPVFNIDQTCDLEHYVVIVNFTGDEDGWFDLTEPFDTFKEAEEWCRKLKERFVLLTDIPF